MNYLIPELHGESFDWLSWRNGSLINKFNIRNRYEDIVLNKQLIIKNAIGYCNAESVICRPKKGYIAVMFDTNESNFNTWWTHFTIKEFNECFKI